MKKFTYPAVVYYDEDNKVYVMYIEELGLVAEGTTMEEVHSMMDLYLSRYMCTALSFGLDIPEASKFSDIQQKNKNNKVVLVDTQIDDLKLKNYS